MDTVFTALDRGGVLVTATRRLARVLTRKYHSWQRDRARTVWRTPSVLPLQAYLRRLFMDWVALGGDLLLLDPTQESLVWEQIIRESRQGAQLLQFEGAARTAMEAWRVVRDFRIPLDGRLAVSDDCEAFLAWAREFERRCERSKWLDGARLADFLRERVRPPRVCYAGFDELPPQVRDLFEAWSAQSISPGGELKSSVSTKACGRAEDETRCAAEWARAALEQNPEACIGIAVLGLERQRENMARIFREVLQPDLPPAGEPAFHIALGRRLASYAFVHGALLVLELASGRLQAAAAGLLLRSPYLPAAEEERSARALLDAKLRQSGAWEVSPAELRHNAAAICPRLSRSLKRFASVIDELPPLQTHTEWSRAFSSLLNAVGWPGDRPLNSHEHQLLARWVTLLSEFAALDSVASAIDLSGAVQRLRRLASSTIFQFEDTGSPIQIADTRELDGVDFDHLWVIGLHDEAFPAPAAPNPFLPVSIQRERGVPHSSAAWEFEAAKRTLTRLSGSAREVVLSYPRLEGDRLLAPSPFLVDAVQTAPAALTWARIMQRGTELDALVGETSPPVHSDMPQRGGSSLLRDMAACPFRAFAKYRIGARELDDIEPGLSASEKGQALHHALQLIWTELETQDRLLQLGPDELASIIRRNVSTAVDRFERASNAAVEKIRLGRLITEWLNLERRRPPFTVVACEQRREITLAGLKLEVRADRVDRLQDGREVILDYKTGDVKPNGWLGERPDEPQVPLYCISSDAPIAAAAFARLQAEGVAFHGIVEGTTLPEFKPYTGREPLPVARLLGGWNEALQALAARYRAGDARVDPKNGPHTCEYCPITPLCRICEAGS